MAVVLLMGMGSQVATVFPCACLLGLSNVCREFSGVKDPGEAGVGLEESWKKVGL